MKKTNSYAEIAAKTYAAKAVKEVNSKLNILTKAKKVVNSSKKKAESTKLNISTPSLDSIVSEFEKYDEKEDIDADEMVVRDRVGRLHEEEELKQASQLDKHQRKVPQRQTANETPSKTLAANDVAATAQLSQQMVKVSTNKDRSDGKRPPSTNTNVNISIELPADLLDKGHNYKQHRDKKITRRSRHYRRRSHKRGGGHRRDVLDNDDDNDSDTSPSSSSSLQSASPSSSPFSLDNRGRPKRSHSSSSRRHAQRHYSYSHKLDKRSSSRSHHHHHRRHQFDTPPQFFYPLYPNFYPPFLPPPPTSFYQMNYGAGGGDYYDHHYHPHHQSGRHHHRNPYEDYEQNIRSLYTNRSGDEHGYKSEWIKSAASGGRHRGHSRRKSAVASTNTSMDTLDDDNDGTESRSSSTQYNSNESMRRMVGSSESRMCKKCGIRSIKWRASDESINSSKPNSLCSLCDLPSDSSDISSNDSITTQSDFSDWDRRASDRYRSKLDDKKRRISTTESTTPSLIPRLKGRSQLKKKGLVGSGKSMSTAKSAPVPASSTLTKKSIAAVSTRPSLNTTAEMKQHRLQPVKPVAATATKTTSKTTPKSTLIKSKSTGNTSSLKPTAKSATLTTLKKDDVRSRSAPAFKAKPAPNLAKAIVYSAADSASTTNATKSALERRREFSKSVQAATKTKSAAIVKAPSKSNATNQNLPRSRAPTNSNKVGSKSAFALPPKTNNNSRSRTSSIKSTSSAPLVKTGGGPMLVKKNWSSDAAVSAKKSTTSAKNGKMAN